MARSIISKPKILFYEDVIDKMDEDDANQVIDFITSDKNNWTLIVTSKKQYWKEKCNRKIIIHDGKIKNETK